METVKTWRDNPTAPPDLTTYERHCGDCDEWDPCPCCGLIGKCPRDGKWYGIGEGCEE